MTYDAIYNIYIYILYYIYICICIYIYIYYDDHHYSYGLSLVTIIASPPSLGFQVAKLTGKVWGKVIQASQSSLASIDMVRNDNPVTGLPGFMVEIGGRVGQIGETW